MAIKIYGKFAAQGLDSEGKPILADAKEIALEQSNNIPSGKDTVQKAIEDLYKNGGGSTTGAAKLQTLGETNQTIPMLDIQQWPRTLLGSINTTYSPKDGELYVQGQFHPDDPLISIGYFEGNTRYTIGEPVKHVVYIASDTNRSYYWDGLKFIEIPAVTIFNLNDKQNYNIWVGTQQDYDSISTYEDNVIYFIGTTPGITPTEGYTISGTLSNGCTLVQNNVTVAAGDVYNGTLYLDEGYVLDFMKITMSGEDITNDEGVLTKVSDSQYNISIQVLSNVVIEVRAIVPISSIIILVGTAHNNKVELTARLLPENTSQRLVTWEPTGNQAGTTVAAWTNATLESNGLSATINILDGADEDQIYVKCSSTFDPSVVRVASVVITHSDEEEPEDPIEEEDFVPFDTEDAADHGVVKSILLPYYDTDHDGKISKVEAKVYNSAVRKALLGNTEITSFNCWKYFNTPVFSIKGCSNLQSVEFPVLSNRKFSRVFGIKDTGLTSINIPEGYTSYDMTVTGTNSDETTNATLQGDTITEIIFPSSLETLDTAIGGSLDSANTPSLPNLAYIDLSNTKVVSLPKNAFNNLRGLQTVKLPDVLEVISAAGIFNRCYNLSRIEFGKNFKGTTSVSLFYNDSSNPPYLTLVFHGDVPGESQGYQFNVGGNRYKLDNNNEVTVNRIGKILVHEEYYDNYKAVQSGFFYVNNSKIEKIEDQQNENQ